MIQVENLWKSYNKTPILKGLSLTVEKGKTLVILGRSGVGKSVLLKHIIGLTQGDQGSILIDGKDIMTLNATERYNMTCSMGMLFQNGALFDSMTIEENIGFFLKQHGDLENNGQPFLNTEIKKRVMYALKMVGLEGAENKLPADLSGGMRKRAALARLIVYKPKYLLYDEPTSGLDPVTAMQINELIVETQKELCATSIVVTHDMICALHVGDQFALHKGGKIAITGSLTKFLQGNDPLIETLKNTHTHTKSEGKKRKTPL